MESFFRLLMCIFLVFCVIFCVNAGILAVDNYGLLYGSLRTFQAHACDDTELRLNCTSNTLISINYVSYGREAGRGDLCPGPGTYDVATCRLDNALTVIEEKCHGYRVCRFLMTPDIFHSDPCPGVRKYAEVAYKCRPELFLNKIVCEGQPMHLNCPNGHSIAVYSAAFGTTRSEVPECRQPTGVHTDDCQVSNASEIFMRHCNGRQQCTLLADVNTFGDRRCIGRKHLKVTYNCVKSDLVKRPPTTEGTSEETIHTTSFPAWVRAFDQPLLNSLRKQQYEPPVRTSTLPSNAFRSEMQSDEVPLEGLRGEHVEGDRKLVGFMSELMSAHKYVKGNKEKLILYVTLSMGLGFLVFVTVLIARFLVGHVQLRPKPKTEPIPVVDDQFFSDSDLEQYDPPVAVDLPPPVVNYSASLRRQSSDAQPRAPVTEGSESNHYFS